MAASNGETPQTPSRRRIASMLGIGDEIGPALQTVGDDLNRRIDALAMIMADIRDMMRTEAAAGRIEMTLFIGTHIAGGADLQFAVPVRMRMTTLIFGANQAPGLVAGMWDIEAGGSPIFSPAFDVPTPAPAVIPHERMLEAGVQINVSSRVGANGAINVWIKGRVAE